MTEYRCYTHGTEHIVPGWSYQGRDTYRCAVDTGDGTQCRRIALPPPPRVRWRRRIMLPERSTVERIMCTLVVGFWIGVWIWVGFIL